MIEDKKIIFWTPEFYPDIGGIQEITKRSLPYFVDSGFNLILFTSHSKCKMPSVTRFNEVDILRFNFWKSLVRRDLKEITKIKSRIKKIKNIYKPDLIHYHWGDAYSYFHVSTMKSYNCPYIVTLHRTVKEHYKGDNSLIGKLLNNAAWVVGVSENTLDEASNLFPKIKNKSSVIYNGLKISNSGFSELNFDKPKLLCLGRVEKEKGFDIAIKAFKEVLIKFPQSRLIIAGDGNELNSLKLLAKNLDIHNKIDFLGPVKPEEVNNVIDQSLIVLLPSRWNEPFPLVALEAALRKRPIIASKMGGLIEQVKDGETGYLVEKENPSQLAKKINNLLSDKRRLKAFGENNYNMVRENFSIEKYVENYKSLYEIIIKESS